MSRLKVNLAQLQVAGVAGGQSLKAASGAAAAAAASSSSQSSGTGANVIGGLGARGLVPDSSGFVRVLSRSGQPRKVPAALVKEQLAAGKIVLPAHLSGRDW